MKQKRLIILVLGLLLLLPLPAAAQSSSTNYQVEEATFGSGGEVDLSSTNYRGQAGVGSLGVGSSSSANYDAESGFFTPNEPFLEMIVNASTINLGNLTTSSTASGSGTFSVRTYLSSTYSVKTLSPPPTSEGGAQLNPMTSGGSPSPGTEQFGINVVANSSPAVGSNPVNVPDNSFADGQAATGYDTANNFRYNVGDTIARAPATAGNQAVGQTNYTVSYIANISSITEAGSYTMNHDLVAVATY